MNITNELISRFQQLEIEKDIKEKRLMTEEDSRNYVGESKIFPEYLLHYELYSGIVNDKNNPYKIGVDAVFYKGVVYFTKESLDKEIERIWKILSEFKNMSEKVMEVMKTCMV